MQFDWSTFALQTLNFAILVWLLHRFLYRPVLAVVDARRAEIDNQYAAARAAEAEAKAQLAAIKAERDSIAAERAAALRAAAAQAEAQATARRAQAERDAAALLARERKTLADERAQVFAEAKRAALDLGLDIARRLLAEVPMTLRAEAWIERIADYFAALPKPETDALKRQLANGAALEVVTASPLPAETAGVWRSRLRQILGDGVAIRYGVDPALVAGAELHFPNAILRFSWRSALAEIRAEIEADGNAGR
jgi:F-type H+-transporting ATPase subunit b